jgi:hypothetical protein
VSSMDFGTHETAGFSRKSGIYRSSSIPMAIWNFYARVPVVAHGGASPHPPGHSSRRADSFARGGGESHPPAVISIRKAEELLHRIKGALTPEEADAAGKAFRAWSEAEGLLLVPREDDERA